MLYLGASHTSAISSIFAKRCFGETLNDSLAENYISSIGQVCLYSHHTSLCDFTSKMLLQNLPHCFARKNIRFFLKACWLFSMNFRESDKSGMLLLQWTKRYPDKCCCTENCFGVYSPGKMGKHPYSQNGAMLFPLKEALGLFL